MENKIDEIASLKPGMNGTIKGTIQSVEPTREIRTKFGKLIRIANAKIEDSTAGIKLTLWEGDIDRVAIGDTITVENGWVSEFKGELQITAGKQGKITVEE